MNVKAMLENIDVVLLDMMREQSRNEKTMAVLGVMRDRLKLNSLPDERRWKLLGHTIETQKMILAAVERVQAERLADAIEKGLTK